MTTDEPSSCPECGIGDAEYGLHEPNCPSGGDGLETDSDREARQVAEGDAIADRWYDDGNR